MADLTELMPSSETSGRISQSHPTVLVFPGGAGDAALFSVKDFSVAFDGGSGPAPSYWNYVRHLDVLNALVVSQTSDDNMQSVTNMLTRLTQAHSHPKIGAVLCSVASHAAFNGFSSVPITATTKYEPFSLFESVGVGRLVVYWLDPSSAKRPSTFAHPALLVWHPFDSKLPTVRFLYPGNCPVDKLYTSLAALQKIRDVGDVLKRPVYIKAEAHSQQKSASARAAARAPLSARPVGSTTRPPVASRPARPSSAATTRLEGGKRPVSEANKRTATKPATGGPNAKPAATAKNDKPKVGTRTTTAVTNGKAPVKTAADKKAAASKPAGKQLDATKGAVANGKPALEKANDQQQQDGDKKPEEPGVQKPMELLDGIEPPTRLMIISMDTEDLQKTLEGKDALERDAVGEAMKLHASQQQQQYDDEQQLQQQELQGGGVDDAAATEAEAALLAEIPSDPAIEGIIRKITGSGPGDDLEDLLQLEAEAAVSEGAAEGGNGGAASIEQLMAAQRTADDPLLSGVFDSLVDKAESNGIHQQLEQNTLIGIGVPEPTDTPGFAPNYHAHVHSGLTDDFGKIDLNGNKPAASPPDPSTDASSSHADSSPGGQVDEGVVVEVKPTVDELKELWGKPLGLPPMPTQPPAGAKTTAATATTKRAGSGTGSGAKAGGQSSSRAGGKAAAPIPLKEPVYFDIVYIPHNGDQCSVDDRFFSMVRASHYVASMPSVSKQLLDSWLTGKKSWKLPEVSCEFVPTYASDHIGIWVNYNQEAMSAQSMNVTGPADRSTISVGGDPCHGHKIEISAAEKPSS